MSEEMIYSKETLLFLKGLWVSQAWATQITQKILKEYWSVFDAAWWDDLCWHSTLRDMEQRLENNYNLSPLYEDDNFDKDIWLKDN